MQAHPTRRTPRLVSTLCCCVAATALTACSPSGEQPAAQARSETPSTTATTVAQVVPTSGTDSPPATTAPTSLEQPPADPLAALPTYPVGAPPRELSAAPQLELSDAATRRLCEALASALPRWETYGPELAQPSLNFTVGDWAIDERVPIADVVTHRDEIDQALDAQCPNVRAGVQQLFAVEQVGDALIQLG